MAQYFISLPKMIAHRGNLDGADPKTENHPDQIRKVLNTTIYGAEIDLWYLHSTWWLGHDAPQYQIDLAFLNELTVDLTIFDRRKHSLWIHCKNMEAVAQLTLLNEENEETRDSTKAPGGGKYQHLNYFFHEEDPMTLTSHGHMWVHPKVKLIPNKSAWVVPHVLTNNLENLNWGRARWVCVDNPNEIVAKYNERN